MERWVKSEVLYEGPIVRLRAGDAVLDDGTAVKREVVEHDGGVGILPYEDGEVFLVRQYRIAIGSELLEIPAGRLEANETPEERAAVELEEEIGRRAGRITPLSTFYPSPGFTNQVDYVFLATELTETERRPEFDERIEVVRLSLDEAESMLLRSDALVDGKTAVALYALFARLGRIPG